MGEILKKFFEIMRRYHIVLRTFCRIFLNHGEIPYIGDMSRFMKNTIKFGLKPPSCVESSGHT